jgi:hypothetical protein
MRCFRTAREAALRVYAGDRAGTALAESGSMSEDTTPGGTAERRVDVVDSVMRIHDLRIDRPGIVAYMTKIAADKREIALVHALEVGITELIARRERFRS